MLSVQKSSNSTKVAPKLCVESSKTETPVMPLMRNEEIVPIRIPLAPSLATAQRAPKDQTQVWHPLPSAKTHFL